jgi:Flp pilus assembly protein TadD
VTESPTDARALQREAFQHFVAGRLDEAVAAYQRAIASDASLAIAWNGLAMVLERKGDLDGAIAAAQRLVELEPEEALGHTSLSRFYQQKGWIERAETEKALATKLAMKSSGKR